MNVLNVPTTRVTILALEGIMGYTLSGPFDVFSSLGSCWEAVSGESPKMHFDVRIAGSKTGSIETFNKFQLKCQNRFSEIDNTDLIIIPSVALKADGELTHEQELYQWLASQHRRGAILASICAGSFILAQSGLLDGRLATTHWAFSDLFRQKYPNVNLQPDEMLTEEDRIICAGGSTSWQYLTSYLLDKFGGSDLASQANRFFLLSGNFDKQTPCIPLAAALAEQDLVIRDVQIWIQEHITEQDLLTQAIAYSGLAERTFKRRFKQATMQTPLEYVQNIRIEKAKRLLENSDNTIMDIMDEIGYAEDSYFRRLFKRKVGVTANEYRRGFNMVSSR